MRIRFTLDITRTPKPEPAPADEPDFINNQGFAHLERNEESIPLGFTGNPPPEKTPY